MFCNAPILWTVIINKLLCCRIELHYYYCPPLLLLLIIIIIITIIIIIIITHTHYYVWFDRPIKLRVWYVDFKNLNTCVMYDRFSQRRIRICTSKTTPQESPSTETTFANLSLSSRAFSLDCELEIGPGDRPRLWHMHIVMPQRLTK